MSTVTLGSLVSMGGGGVDVDPIGWDGISLVIFLVVHGKLKSSAMSP